MEVWAMDAHLVFAGLFRAIHGLIGIIEDGRRVEHGSIERSDASGEGKRIASATTVADALCEAQAAQVCFVFVRVWQDDGELFAADAGGKVAGAGVSDELGGEGLEAGIPGGVAKGIVAEFEVVQINDDHR